MPLATKNNAIIVKDGKVAENCGCCGDSSFLCLRSCPPARLFVTVSAQKYVNRVMGRVYSNSNGPTGAGVGFVSYFPGDQYSGTFELARTSATTYEYVYTQSPACSFNTAVFPNDFFGEDKAKSFLRFDLETCRFSASFRMLWETSTRNFPSDTPPRAIADLDCSMRATNKNSSFPEDANYFGSPIGNVPASTSTGIGPIFFPFDSMPLFTFRQETCSSVFSPAPAVASFTLPEQWWLQGAFGFYGISAASFVNPIVFEQSGSRNVSFYLHGEQNALP